MFRGPRLRPAGLLAVLASIVALSCGSDVIDLLPPPAGGVGNGGGAGAGGGGGGGVSNVGASDSAERAGADSAGADVGGTLSNGGSGFFPSGGMGAFSGNSGGFAMGGQGGRGGGCFGPGCGGFGGAFSFPCEMNGPNTCTPCQDDTQCGSGQHCSHNICLQCWNDQQCSAGYNCDLQVGRCQPSCQGTLDCRDGRVCDQTRGVCVGCTQNEGCPSPSDPDARICHLRRCVECESNQDCTLGSCVFNHCIECLSDKDCGDRGLHCDTGSGRCLPAP
jgi:hypothetical protein